MRVTSKCVHFSPDEGVSMAVSVEPWIFDVPGRPATIIENHKKCILALNQFKLRELIESHTLTDIVNLQAT